MTDHPSPLPMAPFSPIGATLDQARERAIRLLTDGFAYDAITVEEFEWRLGQLSHAESARAIDALVADLAAPQDVAATRQAAVLAPAEGRILGFMSETRREGPWRVPRLLQVNAVMSDVKIDLRHAVLPPSCAIDVSAVMANVQFIAPPGMVVDFDVSAIMASARNDVRAQRLDAHLAPHVRIRGYAFMAEVRVRVRELGR